MPPISALHSAQGSKKALQEVKSMSHQVVELLRDGEQKKRKVLFRRRIMAAVSV